MDTPQNFLFYSNPDGKDSIRVIIDDQHHTVWTTQKGMSEIFEVGVPAINKHLSNIYEERELKPETTISKMEIVQQEGVRKVKRSVEYYNLDAIISVGYRVNSQCATRFRIWATGILRDYLVKGFAMDDDRLKQGKSLFGKDYFLMNMKSCMIQEPSVKQLQRSLQKNNSINTGLFRILLLFLISIKLLKE